MDELQSKAVEAHNALLALLEMIQQQGNEELTQQLAQIVQAYRQVVQQGLGGGQQEPQEQGPATVPPEAGMNQEARPM